MVTKVRRARDSLLTLCLISLVFASCAKIKVTTPSSRYISPEAKGKLFSGTARIEQQVGTEGTLDFVGDSLENPLELRNNVTAPSISLDLGIAEKIDFIIKGNSGAPTVYTVKYQFIGENKKAASKGNKSLALTLGYGQSDESQTEDDDTIFNESSDDLNAEITQALFEVSIIYGYRPQEDTLLYTSIQASKQDISFELKSKTNTNLNVKSFTLNSWSYGASLGAIRYFDTIALNVEISAQRTDWNYNDPMTYAFISAALSKSWD
jgi:hypothetical protein